MAVMLFSSMALLNLRLIVFDLPRARHAVVLYNVFLATTFHPKNWRCKGGNGLFYITYYSQLDCLLHAVLQDLH